MIAKLRHCNAATISPHMLSKYACSHPPVFILYGNMLRVISWMMRYRSLDNLRIVPDTHVHVPLQPIIIRSPIDRGFTLKLVCRRERALPDTFPKGNISEVSFYQKYTFPDNYVTHYVGSLMGIGECEYLICFKYYEPYYYVTCNYKGHEREPVSIDIILEP